mmetsp:Transcript_85277/g.260717  ORF Transcript_85277/g.260717 Transcript_85277/m.260717 type:complete len:252 (-) Transcript_85277:478-1233(-)
MHLSLAAADVDVRPPRGGQVCRAHAQQTRVWPGPHDVRVVRPQRWRARRYCVRWAGPGAFRQPLRVPYIRPVVGLRLDASDEELPRRDAEKRRRAVRDLEAALRAKGGMLPVLIDVRGHMRLDRARHRVGERLAQRGRRDHRGDYYACELLSGSAACHRQSQRVLLDPDVCGFLDQRRRLLFLHGRRQDVQGWPTFLQGVFCFGDRHRQRHLLARRSIHLPAICERLDIQKVVVLDEHCCERLVHERCHLL